MKLSTQSTLLGINRYHKQTVVKQDIDLGFFSTLRTDTAGPYFAEGFKKMFGSLKTLEPHPEGDMFELFLKQLFSPQGASFAETLFQAILAIESSMAFALHRLDSIRFHTIIKGDSPEKASYIWRCRIPSISRRIPKIALLGVAELLPDNLRSQIDTGQASFKESRRALWRSARDLRLSPSTSLLVQAAERRGIPWEMPVRNWIRLGQGKHQRLASASITDNTSWFGIQVSGNKAFTTLLLEEARLPVPQQKTVNSVEEALTASESIGYPVVLKPLRGNKGGGVTAGLTTPQEVETAYIRAASTKGSAQASGSVLVESFVEGDDHRILVFDGKAIAVVKRMPPSITGDGRRTVSQLIEELNADPMRDELRRCRVTNDSELQRLLRLKGFTMSSVLPEGKELFLRTTANVSTGGNAIDVTDKIHPDNIEMAERAIKIMGLDIGGLDFLTPDIGISYKDAGGIVEVNARPGLRPHSWPVAGKPRDVAGAMVDMLFPGSSQRCRVPAAAVIGQRGTFRVSRFVDLLLQARGYNSGRVTRKIATINGDHAGPAGQTSTARRLQSTLRDQRLDTLVYATSPRTLVNRGLRLDHYHTAAIIDLPEDADDDWSLALGTLMKTGDGRIVMPAEVAERLIQRNSIHPSRLTLVNGGHNTDPLARHLDNGGRIIKTTTESDSCLVIEEANRVLANLPLRQIKEQINYPITAETSHLLLAVALAFDLDDTLLA